MRKLNAIGETSRIQSGNEQKKSSMTVLHLLHRHFFGVPKSCIYANARMGKDEELPNVEFFVCLAFVSQRSVNSFYK